MLPAASLYPCTLSAPSKVNKFTGHFNTRYPCQSVWSQSDCLLSPGDAFPIPAIIDAWMHSAAKALRNITAYYLTPPHRFSLVKLWLCGRLCKTRMHRTEAFLMPCKSKNRYKPGGWGRAEVKRVHDWKASSCMDGDCKVLSKVNYISRKDNT